MTPSLELTENFRAKLGWLTGNLFSRIGTEDYFPSVAAQTQEKFDEIINEVLSKSILFVPDKKFSQVTKLIGQGKSWEEIDRIIANGENLANTTKISQLVALVGRTVPLSKEQKNELINAFNQDVLVRKILN